MKTLQRGFAILLSLTTVGVLTLGVVSCRLSEESATDSGAGVRERPVEVPVLDKDLPIERELGPAEVHLYSLVLEPGDFVRVVVDQRGVDVVTSLFDPDGEFIGSIDRRINDLGEEQLIALAEKSGVYQLEVRAAAGDKPRGRYEVKVVDLRPATAMDPIRARAAGVFATAEELRRQRDYDGAVDGYREALELWRETGDRFWQAETLDRLGLVNVALDRWDQALSDHQQSARLFGDLGDDRSESIALNQLANVRFHLGQVKEALRDGQRALELRREGDSSGRVRLLINLASTHQALDEVAEAIEHYDRARELLLDAGDSAERAQILHQLGFLYRTLGESLRALDYLDEAEAMWLRLGETSGRAASIHQRGRVYFELGRMDEASREYEQALELRRETEHLRGQVAALTSLGEVLRARSDTGPALVSFQTALEILRSEPRPSLVAEARILRNLGWLSNAHEAREFFGQSLELSRRMGDLSGEAESLLGIARVERRLGDVAAALRAVETALDIAESVRPKSFSDDLSHSFFATVQPYFELYVDLQMEQHRLSPSGGHDAKALAAIERARARALLDLLSETGAEIRSVVQPELVAREKALQREINIAERWRLSLFADRRRTADEQALAARTVRSLLDDLGRLRAEIRRTSPRYSALTQPQTLGLGEIQGSILDEDTLLLEYWLGVDRSFLFVVSTDSLVSVELPGRQDLEARVLRAYRLLTRSHRPESRRVAQEALCGLSRILLGPIADRLEHKKLVIVPDGALQYLPFSALADLRDRDECSTAQPLLLSNETTYLPSASVLAVLRKETAGRRQPDGLVAVVADPVFSRQDERVTGAASGARDPEGPSHLADYAAGDLGDFHRLRFSRSEAEAVLALAPPESSLRAFDFEATKELVQRGGLANHRIVHLATHAVLDSTQPGLSGIVLSLVDRAGVDQDGFLRAHEIYDLRLPADLVVLSACRTALGKEVKGEGLVGLSRAFAYAGAQRLIAGLWNVQDRSTAKLMEQFYRRLFVEGARPSAALRAAQISLWRERPAPYYWAGFVLQGEYR